MWRHYYTTHSIVSLAPHSSRGMEVGQTILWSLRFLSPKLSLCEFRQHNAMRHFGQSLGTTISKSRKPMAHRVLNQKARDVVFRAALVGGESWELAQLYADGPRDQRNPYHLDRVRLADAISKWRLK